MFFEISYRGRQLPFRGETIELSTGNSNNSTPSIRYRYSLNMAKCNITTGLFGLVQRWTILLSHA